MSLQTQDPADKVEPRKFIDADNVVSALTFMIMKLAVSFLPEGAVRRFGGWLGRTHLSLRGSKAGDLALVPELNRSGTDLRQLERQIMMRSYEELAQPFLERRQQGWHPDISLEGREHLDRAMADGRGAVLWVIPSFSGEMVFRKAIHGAGYPLVDLRTASHPYSGTTFGMKYLNPIRLEVENRYMTERILLEGKNDTESLLKLKEQLKQNRIVKFMASPNSENPPEFPLFGGSFALALGAPALARLAKAPLMPVFITETQPGSFTVRIGTPLEIAGRGAGRSAWDALGAEYVSQMKDHILRNPDQWPGWYARDSWTPYTGADPTEPVTDLGGESVQSS
jgi:lauroyl/myristoyl acyltransferase